MQAGGGTKSSVLGIKACLEHAEEGSGVQVMTLQEIGGVGVVLWRGEERSEKKIAVRVARDLRRDANSGHIYGKLTLMLPPTG